MMDDAFDRRLDREGVHAVLPDEMKEKKEKQKIKTRDEYIYLYIPSIENFLFGEKQTQKVNK